MTTEEKKSEKSWDVANNSEINTYQTFVNKEFDKTFKIDIKGNKYSVAISNNDIPKISSYIFENDKIVIIISDYIFDLDTDIFKLTEDSKGNKIAVFNFQNKHIQFSEKRSYWKSLIDVQNSYTKPTEFIKYQKNKKLVHAFLDIIKYLISSDTKIEQAVLQIENI